MLECAIVGDSIAVGVSRAMPQCQRIAIGNISSQTYAKNYTKDVKANRVLISIGSNDGVNVNSEQNMTTMRKRITGKVTWLLSANNSKANEAAKKVAKAFGDNVLEVKPYVGPDKVHPNPAGYKNIVKDWK